MREHDLEPDFPPAALEQLRAISAPASERRIADPRSARTALVLDRQRRLARPRPAVGGAAGCRRPACASWWRSRTSMRPSPPGSPLDAHASANTTSVYTAAQVFPMLPERLSTDLTCLAEHAGAPQRGRRHDDNRRRRDQRLATIYRAAVVQPRQARLRQRRRVARRPRGRRRRRSPRCRHGRAAAHPGPAWRSGSSRCARAQGALGLTTLEAQAVRAGAVLLDLKPDEDNRAKQLIEYFMIAANGVVARYLESKGSPSLRRVLRQPERWEPDRAARARLRAEPAGGARCPGAERLPQSRSARRHRRSFPDLSLAVVKLLGARRVRAQAPRPAGRGTLRAGAERLHPRHRAQPPLPGRHHAAAAEGGAARARRRPTATRSCARSRRTARRRRATPPRSSGRWRSPPQPCCCRPASASSSTPSSPARADKGTWVRITHPLAEGRLVEGFAGLDVGDTLRVRLIHTDVQRGFIDFARVG